MARVTRYPHFLRIATATTEAQKRRDLQAINRQFTGYDGRRGQAIERITKLWYHNIIGTDRRREAARKTIPSSPPRGDTKLSVGLNPEPAAVWVTGEDLGLASNTLYRFIQELKEVDCGIHTNTDGSKTGKGAGRRRGVRIYVDMSAYERWLAGVIGEPTPEPGRPKYLRSIPIASHIGNERSI